MTEWTKSRGQSGKNLWDRKLIHTICVGGQWGRF